MPDSFEGVTKFLTYEDTHNQLVLTNVVNVDDHSFQEFEIRFEGVFYLEIQTIFLSPIVIYEANEEDKIHVTSRCVSKIYWEFGQKVFVIESLNYKYFIGAIRYFVKSKE